MFIFENYSFLSFKNIGWTTSSIKLFFLEFQKYMLKQHLVLLLHYIKWNQSLSLCQAELSWPPTTLHTQILPLSSINSINLKKEKKSTWSHHHSRCTQSCLTFFPLIFNSIFSTIWTPTRHRLYPNHQVLWSTTVATETHQNSHKLPHKLPLSLLQPPPPPPIWSLLSDISFYTIISIIQFTVH